MKFFDYVLYRIFKHYEHRKKKNAFDLGVHLSNILILVAIVDVLLLIDLLFFQVNLENPNHYRYTIGVPIGLIIIFLNEYRVKRKFKSERFQQTLKRWDNEDVSTKKIRKWLIIVTYLVICILLPWLFAILNNRH